MQPEVLLDTVRAHARRDQLHLPHKGAIVIIYSSGKPIDRTWRTTFKPTPGLREASQVEYQRVHEILHKQANLLQMCICGSYGPNNETKETA